MRSDVGFLDEVEHNYRNKTAEGRGGLKARLMLAADMSNVPHLCNCMACDDWAMAGSQITSNDSHGVASVFSSSGDILLYRGSFIVE